MVTPLVYDLNLDVDADGWIEAVSRVAVRGRH